MELAKEANVEYVVISGSTDSDVELDALTDLIRHSLRTQFGCKKVAVAIEERLQEKDVCGCTPSDGVSYH